ncbi:hypothetical protein QBC39DRAFT_68683 [Podospora conica]|nr:hypothetical protein QBC39DRAFT_68683 [Schizothecium conicum]
MSLLYTIHRLSPRTRGMEVGIFVTPRTLYLDDSIIPHRKHRRVFRGSHISHHNLPDQSTYLSILHPYPPSCVLLIVFGLSFFWCFRISCPFPLTRREVPHRRWSPVLTRCHRPRRPRYHSRRDPAHPRPRYGQRPRQVPAQRSADTAPAPRSPAPGYTFGCIASAAGRGTELDGPGAWSPSMRTWASASASPSPRRSPTAGRSRASPTGTTCSRGRTCTPGTPAASRQGSRPGGASSAASTGSMSCGRRRGRHRAGSGTRGR